MPIIEQLQCLDPTPEEIALRELRDKLEDVICDDNKFDDDFYLLQWLKAQKMNPGKAETMIRNSIAWRKTNGIIVPECADDYQCEIGESVKFLLNSKDKNGAPVVCIHLGKSDLRKAIEIFGRERVSKYFYTQFARVEAMMIEHNKRNNANTKRITSDCSTGITAILNSSGYSMRQAQSLESLRVYLDIARCGVGYFPAVLSRICFVNINRIFSMILKLIKPLLTIPGLKQEVYGHDEEVWRKALLERIDARDLYPDFGGIKPIDQVAEQ
ncbi:unnamed protein product [Allacma fusca]|uniref:CRAL-TRIO domain-containing protein n=1 Tax=Allacma fusca TaxID=39272 RepID=A0A8J2PCD6_9HEXA|nr:unnamed protein product [Allacma fusca]